MPRPSTSAVLLATALGLAVSTAVGPASAAVGPEPAQAPAASVAAAHATGAAPAAALPAGPMARYLVCVPGVDVPRPNYRYPFSFMLTTKYQHSTSKAVRTAVRSIQQVLNAENYPGPGSHLKVDGSYGPKTRAAVIIYQRHHGRLPDGKVGPKTWRSLAGNCWKYH